MPGEEKVAVKETTIDTSVTEEISFINSTNGGNKGVLRKIVVKNRWVLSVLLQMLTS